MKIVIFGLTVSSSWGNGHATLWRGLIKALTRRGHSIAFFERDVPYYAQHRDLIEIPKCELFIYPEWEAVLPHAKETVQGADIAMVTSYCVDALPATEMILSSNAQLKIFYDLDTPVTLEHLRASRHVSYIGSRGLRDFDLVLSYTGGAALEGLRNLLDAVSVAPLYGSVDPEAHYPDEPKEEFRSDLSYLGTYAEDRQVALESLFIDPARELPHKRFLIGGAQYPGDFPWSQNIFFVQHVPPLKHSSFYSSSRLTLNVTRQAMADMGFCPSGRLFEAAACRTAIVSDWWEGLGQFFKPGIEIICAKESKETVAAMALSDEQLERIASAARERVLAEHTAEHRAAEFERLMNAAYSRAATRTEGALPFYQNHSQCYSLAACGGGKE